VAASRAVAPEYRTQGCRRTVLSPLLAGTGGIVRTDCRAGAEITRGRTACRERGRHAKSVLSFHFSPSRSHLTAVFATLEQQLIRENQMSDLRVYERLRRGPPPANIKAVTPSKWPAEGFYRAGFDVDQVLVVPHGVDTATFHPMPDVRKDIRSGIPILDGEFVFLSVGAMSGNKGIDLLLRGFAEVCRKFPDARLVLKGMDRLYDSRAYYSKAYGPYRPAISK
jgi:glycosyltransferase involved in cell wall biosynthesis